MLLCEQTAEAGWDVRVISLLQPEAYVAELEQLGIPMVALGLRKGVLDPRPFWRLVQVLRKWRPDILHCHQVHANLAGRLARLFVRIPAVICTAHSINEGRRWREIGYRLTDPLCDLTTNVCRAGRDRYIRIGTVPASKIEHVPNAVDVRPFAATRKSREEMRRELGVTDEFLWIAVGNLRAPKDYATMLRSFEQVAARRPRTRLLVVGSGPLREELESGTAKVGLAEVVSFLGARDDVASLLRASDGFVMSSTCEGTPMAVLEASASGLPIVATSVGGVPEAVVDGETGILVPCHDPAALAAACMTMMNASPERRAAFGQAAQRRIQNDFGIDVVMKEWQRIYLNVLAAK
jgi:glycosyltransferase involved in cell wall biosynthesis